MPCVLLKSLYMCPCKNISLTSKATRGNSFWSQTPYSNVGTVLWIFFVNKKEQKEAINQGTLQTRRWEPQAVEGSSKGGGGARLHRLPARSLRCYLMPFLPFGVVEAKHLLNSKRKYLIEGCQARHRGGQWVVLRGLKIAQENLALDQQHSNFLPH